MLRITASAALLLATSTAPHAAEPLSFDFMVTGSPVLRPVIVFHDGRDTYLQLEGGKPKGLTVVGAKAEQYGPYLLIPGIHEAFSLKAGNQVTTVAYTGNRQAPPAARQETKPSVAAPVAAPVHAVALSTRTTPLHVASAPTQFLSEDELKRAKAEKVAQPKKEMQQPEACLPKVSRSESAYVVGFNHNAIALGGHIEEKIRQIIGDTSDIEAVHVKVEAPGDSAQKATARANAITKFLDSIGVSSEKVKTGQRNRSGMGTEMRVVRAKLIPCAGGAMRVEAVTRDSVTAVAEGDAKEVIGKIAGTLGLAFRTEGREVPIKVSVSETEKPLVLILERIGEAVTGKADVIYRSDELTLRYR